MTMAIQFKTNMAERDFVEILSMSPQSVAFGRILALVEDAGCKSIAIENEPHEDEYGSEYSAFFSRVLTTSERRHPTRFHFFDRNVESEDEAVREAKSYLGFCDLRPTPAGTVSMAFLDQTVFIKTNKDYVYLLCSKPFKVPLGEHSIEIQGFPFIQQDGRIVRCAQAALASVSQFYEIGGFTGPDITDYADELPSGARSIPSRGLTVEQIGHVLKKMDRFPIVYDFTRTPEDPDITTLQHREQLIYRYVESGIPVIIGIEAGNEMHAMVVIGHTFSPDSWLAETSQRYYDQPRTGTLCHCCTNWIERFVVQDDNLGPYTLVPSFLLQHALCKLIIVPLPPNVFLTGEEAEMFAADLLCPQSGDFSEETLEWIATYHKENNSVDADTLFWHQQFHDQAHSNELVLRTYLMPSCSWLEHQKNIPSFVQYEDLLQDLPLPDYVWVVEVSWPQIYRHKRRICGEMVLDATDQVSPTVGSLQQVWLWMHFPGIVLRRDVRDNKSSLFILESPDPIRACRQSTSSSLL